MLARRDATWSRSERAAELDRASGGSLEDLVVCIVGNSEVDGVRFCR